MNIGELTAILGADSQYLRSSVNRAEAIMTEYARHVDTQLGKTDRYWKESANTVSTQTKKMDSSIASTSKSLEQMKSHALGLRSAISVIGTGMALKNLFDVGKEVSMLNTSFEAIFGSAEDAGKEFEYVKKVSDEMGQNFYVIARQFKSLSAAAQGTIMQGEGVHDIFRAIVKASASLGLSSYETEGALYAVQQMISKATVQSEELRGQLGERLPGAFRMAAEAMGMTMPELSKQLELGNVLAEDLLPKLAVVLENTYSGKVSEAVAASNKLSEAWTTVRYNIADSGFLTQASSAMQALAASMNTPEMQSDLSHIGTGLGEIIKSSRSLIPLLGDLARGAGNVASAIGSIVSVYTALPSEVTSGVSSGIVARVLTGSTQIGVVTGLIVSLNTALEKTNDLLGENYGLLSSYSDMEKSGKTLWQNLKNMVEVAAGLRDWNTGKLTEKGKAAYGGTRKEELREKYIGTWGEYDKQLSLTQARQEKAYQDQQKLINAQVQAMKDKQAFINGTNLATVSKEEAKAIEAFYSEYRALTTDTYEEELQNLTVQKHIYASFIDDKVALEEWFQIKKKQLQEKYQQEQTENRYWTTIYPKQLEERMQLEEYANKQAISDFNEFQKKYQEVTLTSEQIKRQSIERQLKIWQSLVDRGLIAEEQYLTVRQEMWDEFYEEYAEKDESWRAAVADGMEEAAKDIGWTYTNIKNTVEDAFSGMTEALTNFAMTGKSTFEDFAESVISDMIRMQIQAEVTAPLASGLSSLLGSVGNSIANAWYGNVPAVGPDGPMQPSSGFANGGIFNSPSLHSYVNTVQTTPKLFTFAQGGVFAEAGPEAVMPLTRTSDNKLGVSAEGVRGDTYYTYNIDARGAKPGVEEAIISALNDINNNLEKRAIKAVVNAANSGGSFAKAVGRTR
jgi:lambda family phage tail tape measure protein